MEYLYQLISVIIVGVDIKKRNIGSKTGSVGLFGMLLDIHEIELLLLCEFVRIRGIGIGAVTGGGKVSGCGINRQRRQRVC